ncbi:hypothetical protein [Thermotomaculum hydrothermale]|uniref:hypothetical protein n=1 Tax=Thermotomaculum hydrothermale TaxID=981385 RepID=UPI00191547CF|nr:hypothetical protein [Thermotomaculum hydrothermale]
MTVLLVILTFAVCFAIGTYLERKREAEKRVKMASMVANAAFAQDGGEPVKDTEEKEDRK